MILPDVNVLVYAFRPDVPEHAICRPWLLTLTEGDSQFGMSPLVLAALVRIVTNRRIHTRTSSIEGAFAFCDALLANPLCRVVEPGVNHFSIFRRLCIETPIVGPMTTDAWYAALAIEHGCEWITMDRDYARFPGLRWSMPA
jgi:toxin-antitoxin system PIN domain toxin